MTDDELNKKLDAIRDSILAEVRASGIAVAIVIIGVAALILFLLK